MVFIGYHLIGQAGENIVIALEAGRGDVVDVGVFQHVGGWGACRGRSVVRLGLG